MSRTGRPRPCAWPRPASGAVKAIWGPSSNGCAQNSEPSKAITAMAHHLARLVYRMLKYGQEYIDKGMEYYQQRYQNQQIKWLEKKAKDLGLAITLGPASVAR